MQASQRTCLAPGVPSSEFGSGNAARSWGWDGKQPRGLDDGDGDGVGDGDEDHAACGEPPH